MESRPIYKSGKSFRARAEARQRQYRTEVLKVGYSKYGHLLNEEAQQNGDNFITSIAFETAIERQKQGKGVAKRTFENMLSSQAMCFNIFVPLAKNTELSSAVFRQILPAVKTVDSIQFEYTPPNDIFKDQQGDSGVDCDLLVKCSTDNGSMIIVIETKFVESEFSCCGFKSICSKDITINKQNNFCLYTTHKGYLYWERTQEVQILQQSLLDSKECPFRGQLWQLWVNHVLAHIEAKRQKSLYAIFAVCAPENNNRLKAVKKIEDFQKLLINPDSVINIGINNLLSIIGHEIRTSSDKEWHKNLLLRYFKI